MCLMGKSVPSWVTLVLHSENSEIGLRLSEGKQLFVSLGTISTYGQTDKVSLEQWFLVVWGFRPSFEYLKTAMDPFPNETDF